MKFLHSASLTVFTRILALGLTGLATILIARILGPFEQGIFSGIRAFLVIVIIFGSLGLYASNIYFVSKDKKLLKKAAGNSLLIATFLGTLLFLGIFISTIFLPQVYGNIPLNYLLIFSLTIPFILLSSFFSGLLLAVNKIKEYNLFIFIRALSIFLGVLILLFLLKKSIKEIILFLVVVEVLISWLFFFIIYRYKKFSFSFDRDFFLKMMRYGVKFYLASNLIYLVLRFDLVIVNYFLGSYSTGIYSISAKISEALFLIPSTVALIFFPKVSSLKEKARPFANKVLLGVSGVMLLACLLSLLLAKPFILFLFGEAYFDSILPFQILIPGIFFLSLGAILMTYFASRGMPLLAIFTPFLGLMVNIILNLYLIPLYGINGAAISSSLTYTLMFSMLFWYYRNFKLS
jgi:O-antigen/teichoic acid export membrane protein